MSTADIAAGKYFARLIRQQRDDLAELLVSAYDQVMQMVDSGTLDASGFADTMRWAKAHEHAQLIVNVTSLGIDNSLLMAKAADEHVESIAVLMEGDRESYVSTIALLRSAAEALVQICYFFDPDVRPIKRFLRAAAYHVESVSGVLKTSRAYGPRMPEADLREKEAVCEEVLDALRDGGLLISRLEPGDEYFGRVELDGVGERTRFNATDAFKKFLPGEPFEWQAGSGATHSLGWFLVSMLGGTEYESDATDESTYGATTLSLFNLTDAVIRVVGAASGIDTTEYLKRSFRRRKAVVAKASNQSFSSIDRETYDARPVGRKLKSPPGGSAFRRPRRVGR